MNRKQERNRRPERDSYDYEFKSQDRYRNANDVANDFRAREDNYRRVTQDYRQRHSPHPYDEAHYSNEYEYERQRRNGNSEVYGVEQESNYYRNEPYIVTIKNYHPPGGRIIEKSDMGENELRESNFQHSEFSGNRSWENDAHDYNRPDNYRWNARSEPYSNYYRDHRRFAEGDYMNDFNRREPPNE
jgi:hypothetical protein